MKNFPMFLTLKLQHYQSDQDVIFKIFFYDIWCLSFRIKPTKWILLFFISFLLNVVLMVKMNAFSMKSAHSEGCHNCPYLDKFCTAATSKDQAKWILTTFYFYVAQLTIHRKILKIHRAGRRYCQSERESLVDVIQMLSTKL